MTKKITTRWIEFDHRREVAEISGVNNWNTLQSRWHVEVALNISNMVYFALNSHRFDK